MKNKFILLLCFCLTMACVACASSMESEDPVFTEPTPSVENENPLFIEPTPSAESERKIIIETRKDSYKYEDQAISYSILNPFTGYVDCNSFGSLQKKTGDAWKSVPFFKPDPLAWCGTPSLLNSGIKTCKIPFLIYNGTLTAGTYRIAFGYTFRDEGKGGIAYSNEFTLTGEFPMSEGYPPPANVYLEFETDTLSENSSIIKYKIINESDGDVFIFPTITLLLYQDSEWQSFIYNTDTDNFFTSSEKEISRVIDFEKLPDQFANFSKIRIIEQLAIPQFNVFFAFHEIAFE